jgi:hypothetical protein
LNPLLVRNVVTAVVLIAQAVVTIKVRLGWTAFQIIISNALDLAVAGIYFWRVNKTRHPRILALVGMFIAFWHVIFARNAFSPNALGLDHFSAYIDQVPSLMIGIAVVMFWLALLVLASIAQIFDWKSTTPFSARLARTWPYLLGGLIVFALAYPMVRQQRAQQRAVKAVHEKIMVGMTAPEVIDILETNPARIRPKRGPSMDGTFHMFSIESRDAQEIQECRSTEPKYNECLKDAKDYRGCGARFPMFAGRDSWADRVDEAGKCVPVRGPIGAGPGPWSDYFPKMLERAMKAANRVAWRAVIFTDFRYGGLGVTHYNFKVFFGRDGKVEKVTPVEEHPN